ncbi:hypothetical protein COCOBI_07-2540 [Coccomyxa sp. Obi]|nr:hypothetical protein COCOBI_07-2540 [Coccomyxa sp. Obi]
MVRGSLSSGYGVLTSLLQFARSPTAPLTHPLAAVSVCFRGGILAPEIVRTDTSVTLDRQHRCFARQRSTDDTEYMLEKKAFRSALSDLRRQWEGERKKALNLQKQRQAAAKLRQERFVERRRKLRGERQAAMAEARTKLEELNRSKRDLAFEEGAMWRTAVQGIYDGYREQRRQVLLEQSRNWIRAEDLDARIEEALDNPVPLMK